MSESCATVEDTTGNGSYSPETTKKPITMGDVQIIIMHEIATWKIEDPGTITTFPVTSVITADVKNVANMTKTCFNNLIATIEAS